MNNIPSLSTLTTAEGTQIFAGTGAGVVVGPFLLSNGWQTVLQSILPSATRAAAHCVRRLKCSCAESQAARHWVTTADESQLADAVYSMHSAVLLCFGAPSPGNQ